MIPWVCILFRMETKSIGSVCKHADYAHSDASSIVTEPCSLLRIHFWIVTSYCESPRSKKSVSQKTLSLLNLWTDFCLPPHCIEFRSFHWLQPCANAGNGTMNFAESSNLINLMCADLWERCHWLDCAHDWTFSTKWRKELLYIIQHFKKHTDYGWQLYVAECHI